MAAGTVASILKLGLKISSKSSGTMRGVVGSTKKLDKSVKKGLRIKQRLRIAEKKYMKKRRERLRRKEKEAELEQQKSQRKTPTNRTKGVGKTLLERLISFVQILIVGFIANKLPQILETIKNVIKTIRDIVDKFKAFFNGVVGFFKSIGKVIGNVFNFIQSIDLGGIKDKIQESFGGFKDALGNLTGGFLDGVKSVLGFAKKEEQEVINEETDDSEDNQLNSSVKDTQKTLLNQTNSFNDSLKTIEKEGTGLGVVGKENSNIIKENSNTIKTDASDTTLKTDDKGSKENISKIKGKTGSKQETGESSPATGGTSDVPLNQNPAQIGDKLNISKPEKKIDTSTITPERKPKNTVVVVGGQNNSSTPSGGSSSKKVIVVNEKEDHLKDQFTLALF
tara:strand:+ start:410 stop:1591 length:1182 start_codon:yes stop_codon:yes gene_type:complete